MDIAAIKVEEIIKELNRQREARGISYQTVAEACGISQTTIMRIFKGKTEPTITMLQSIAAAVQYVPEEPEQLPPSGYSNEQYTESLCRACPAGGGIPPPHYAAASVL